MKSGSKKKKKSLSNFKHDMIVGGLSISETTYLLAFSHITLNNSLHGVENIQSNNIQWLGSSMFEKALLKGIKGYGKLK